MSARIVMIRSCFAAYFVALAWFVMWFARPTHAAEEDQPRRVALLVGVNQSEKRFFAEKPLQFAERDVQELAAVLREQGFTVRTLTGAGARKADIDAALTAVLTGRKAKDVVVIGFAGHGVQMPMMDDQGKLLRDERGRGLSDAYFCPVDAVFGKGATIISLIVDACRNDRDPRRGAARALAGDELIGRLPGNSAILFSCSQGQEALEHADVGGGHGVFFHHVIEALRGAAADPQTGEVGWNELVAYVCKRVNSTARELDPIGARLADQFHGGRLQTPHQMTNLVATAVLARRPLERARPNPKRADRPIPAGPAAMSIRITRADKNVLQGGKAGIEVEIVSTPPGRISPAGTLIVKEDNQELTRTAVSAKGFAKATIPCPKVGRRILSLEAIPDAPDGQPCSLQHSLTVDPPQAVGDFTGTWKWTRKDQPMGFLTLKPDGAVEANDLPPGVSAPNSYADEGRNGLFKLFVVDERGNGFDRILTRGRVAWKGASHFTLTINQAEDPADVEKTDEFERVAQRGMD
jgi:hypothetical protein